MKNRFFPLFITCALILNIFGAAFADTKPAAGKNQTSQLVALLPASDAVVTFDAKRFMSDALPQILWAITAAGKVLATLMKSKQNRIDLPG